MENVKSWNDRDYVYVNVPEKLLNTTLLQGCHECTSVGTAYTITLTPGSTVYLFYENSGMFFILKVFATLFNMPSKNQKVENI